MDDTSSSSSSSSSSRVDQRSVLVSSSSAVGVDDVDGIRWYFEGPRVGGRLRPNGVVFVDDHRFVLNFCDSSSSSKILAESRHYVTIGDEEVGMTVEPCPIDIIAKCTNRKSSMEMETHEEHIPMQIDVNNSDDNFPLSSSKRINIVPDECPLNCDQPSSDSMLTAEDMAEDRTDDNVIVSMKGADLGLRSTGIQGSRRHSVSCKEDADLVKRIKLEKIESELNREQEPYSEQTFTGSCSDPIVRLRTIQVLDVPGDVIDFLILFLESKKYDGGDLEKFTYDEENHVFVASFLEQSIAERFVSRGFISVQGHDLQISALPEIDQRNDLVKKEKMETDENSEPVATNTIEVKELSNPKLTSEVLKLYFENRKRSGGGTIENIQVFLDEERAVITFQDVEAAKRVIEKSEHLVLGVPVRCMAVDGIFINSPSFAIEVRWSDEKISEEMLLLFFENRKRSGGGPAEDLYYNAEERRAVITFHSPEVVERILQNHRSSPMILDNVRLTICPLRPATFLSSVDGIIEPDKILTHNIPCDSSKDDLIRYLQRGAAASVVKLRYSLHPGTAMAYFNKDYDYLCLRDLVSSRPFRGVMLSIQKVPASHSIQIFNVGSLSIDYLMLYFENPKSGGDEIVKGEMNASENCAILQFADRKVLSSVLAKKHELEGRVLFVSEYHEGLGIMPPDVDDESPAWWLPSDLPLMCESQKLKFIMSSPKLRTKIEKDLESLYCKIEWPVLAGDADPSMPCNLVLHCALSHSTKNVGQLAKTWTDTCKNKMNDELSGILFEKIEILQELWKTVFDQIKSLESNIYDDDSIQVNISDDSCTVQIIGVGRSCENFVETLKALVSKAETTLENEKRKITEQVPKLKCHQFEILKLMGFLESNTDDGVDVTAKGMDVMFYGLPADILAKKLSMYEIINSIVSESVDLPDFVSESLKHAPFRKHMANCLQEKKVISAWDLGPKGLTVFGIDQSEIDKTASILKSEVIQKQWELDAYEASAILLPEWNALKASIKNDFEVVTFKENGSKLTITTTGNNVNAILEVVQSFIKENAIREDFLMTKRGTASIVSQYLKAELQTICSDFQSCRVTIKEDLDISHTGFTVKGTDYGLQFALNKVVELSKKVIEKEKVLDRPGMSNYLRSTRGQKQIEVIQSRHRVFIEDWDEANRSNLVSTELNKRIVNANAGRQARVLDEIRLKNSFVVKVVLGDITEYKVDAIVNAANGQLDHHGGVARVIVDKGGPEIQVECKAYIKSKGSLLPGHLFVSKPGTLPCKYIVHAVGPIWENGRKNEENVLFDTIYNVLAEAEKLKIKSIAMPAISTGVFGFPMRKAAKITLEAVAEFVEKDTPASLQEVHIIDNNRNATKEFKDMLSKHGTPSQKSQRKFDADRPIVIDDEDDEDDDDVLFTTAKSFREASSVARTPPSYLYQTSSGSLLRSESFSPTSSSPPYSSQSSTSSSSSSSSSSSVSSNVLTTQQGLKVTLIKGSIVGQTVDVIVNTTAQNLALNNGAVSSLILQTAGPSIQKECQRNAPSGLTLGQVVVTSGYSLPCKCVYHGYCLNWDNGAGPCEQSIRSLLKAIFLEGHTNLMASVAIPAIGTGNLKVPPDVVARIMYEEVEEFSKTHVGTTLRDIYFVVYDKDQPTVTAFETELHFPKRGVKQKGKKTANRVLAKSKSMSAETSKSAGNVGGGWSISINNVNLEVAEDDITRARTDAIVNSTSENLNLKDGAVSAAILRAGGQEILDECKKIGKMSDGMAVTGAGKLPSKLIFHLKAHSTDRGWKRAIENCLEEAERRKIQSITFPLLGTGNIRAPAKTMASVMLDSVVNFSTKSDPQHLHVIRIAIFQPQMVEEFAQAINALAQDLQSSGLMNQFKVYFKSLLGLADKPPAVKNFDVREIPQQKLRKFEETIRLTIYGLTDKSIECAISELDDLCSDVIEDKVIERDTIAKLSVEQIERIKNLELEFSAKITVEQGHRLNRIRVQGEGHTIVSVVDKIYAIFDEVEKKEREEYHAEIVAKQAQWMYQCDDSYDPYPKPINLIIEKAYQDRAPFAEWVEDDGKYRLDFHRMEETKDQDTTNRVKVKRMTADSTIPKFWDVMSTDELCKRVPLSPSSQEYQDVFSNVNATAGGTVRQILSIERIQNPSLYQQYKVRKDAMQMILQNASTASKVQCERILWHGTSADTLESINHHGFNRSYCGKNAVVYGRGVYFALSFNYSGSNTYAVPDSAGNKHVYQSRVLTGEYVVGNQTYFVAPAKPGSTVSRYDSVVDNPAAPTIFVIFSDTQAYPEYLIVFK